MNPIRILVKADSGYYIATYSTTAEDVDENFIPVYEVGKFYHTLEEALRCL